MFTYFDTPLSQTTLEWQNGLFQPYAGAAFKEFLKNPLRITMPAAAMFAASNMHGLWLKIL